MNTSLFELFKIGIGPSSSHTVGPMRAALRFTRELTEKNLLEPTARVNVDLYGSLALTGIGHGTDRAILLGLLGEAPDTVDPATVEAKIAAIRSTGSLALNGKKTIPFPESENLNFRRNQMYPDPAVHSHPNGMRFTAFDRAGAKLVEEVFYSIGGGFIVSEAERTAVSATDTRTVPYPFRSAEDLLATAKRHNLTISDLVLANEVALLNDPNIIINRPRSTASTATQSPENKIRASILALWQTMEQCTERGIATEGILPGGLNVRRRAHRLAERLNTIGSKDPLAPIDWVTVYAMAVNEENAAGGRVVTAPTNGAAGVIPAIGNYYMRFIEGTEAEKEEGILRYFLTAAAIGILYKENASISGAEVGCQGEVGVACSMAAGGLVAALNGTNAQVEHAAEIAMEHNLGMTCDPIGGLVQIPCIERNGMGAVKAINACRMAMHETGDHKLSLDQVIATMYQTGLDMQSRYKETSLAGLALNIIEC
ncbi:L-serine ammonia-lyase [Tunturibacter empetritectus]|uniref:L-serine dehydratase n=1 Tax=Tunturiibacter lichenicola TaxID=2051959 RepID=A0A7W8N400_9BACT|nr:L-serine ammonia-lyase [Edaphobacter lichenicola]MBB5343081.1 L-serine dehydratase [Edaphobacter lichenicola]